MEEQENNHTKKRVYLTGSQMMKLSRYIEENADTFNFCPMAEVAERLDKEFDFPVTESNVEHLRNCMKEAGMKVWKMDHDLEEDRGMLEILKEMESSIKTLENKFRYWPS